MVKVLWMADHFGSPPNSYNTVVITQLYRMSLYAIVLRYSFVGTKGPKPVPASLCLWLQSELHKHMVCRGHSRKNSNGLHRLLTSNLLNTFVMN